MTARRGTVFCDLTISLDGYSAGLNQAEDRPFGDDGADGGGETLHAWMFETPEENRAELARLSSHGAGTRLFEGVGPLRLEQVESRAATGITHLTYRARS